VSDDPPGPRFSVIIAVRNGAATMQCALDSVFEQTYPEVELIVMDGASTDGTTAIIAANASRIAYWESAADGGVYPAWNKALDHATGDWISFLGSDDRLCDPDVLGRVAAHLVADGGEHLVAYGYIDKIRTDGRVVRSKIGPWDDQRRKWFRRGVMIPHPATFHHRALFERHGRFDESFRIAGDYEFLLREMLEHDPLFVDEVVVEMAGGGISDRPENVYVIEREVYRARYLHGLVKAPPWRSGPLYRRLGRIWISRHLGQGVARAARDGYKSLTRRSKRPT
jgi:glycosyltransferase involved in cell wall biosynthesis